MATADEEQTASSFMMLCIGAHFSSKLWIPEKFVRKYRQIAQQASVMVESDDGRFWEVEIKDMNGDLFMKDGWSEVVKDNHISEFDFLTFRLVGVSTFKLSIYTFYCCPRDLAPPTSGGGDDEMSNKTPSFFKALSNTADFTKLLRVPPVFFEKYGLAPPENAKLRVQSGRTWDVKVERLLESGLFCFTRGWRNFAEDAGLQLNEFLVLSLTREWEFNVVIYDTGLCERKIRTPGVESATATAAADGTQVMKKRKTRNCYPSSKESDPLYMEIHLRQFHKSRITLHKKFIEAAGLWRKKHVMLKHVEKRICISVALDHRRNMNISRIDFAKGWSDFREANELEYRRTYSFRFDPVENVILVDEVKEHK